MNRRAFHIQLLGALVVIAGIDVWFSVDPRILDPTDISWMTGDPAVYQLGWDFLRRDTHWHFPPTWTGALGYPIGVSVAYMDSIPLLAVGFRALKPLLPQPFQYLGLFVVASCLLQVYFAYSLFLKLLNRDMVFAAISAVFVLLAPAFTWRSFAGHMPLGAHWLILAALSCYFDDRIARGLRHYLAPFAVLLFLAGTINPYLQFMTFLIAVAALGRLRLEGRSRLLPLAAAGAVLATVCIAALVLAGFLMPGERLAGGGYGHFSMNLLSPVDPQGYESMLLKAQPSFPGQDEGYNYLGLGIIVMLTLGAMAGPKALNLLSAKALPLLVVFVISTLLALSTKATAARWTIYDLSLPPAVLDAFATLRASGRLFWPALYLAMAAAILLLHRAVPRPRALLLLIALLLVQVLDTASLHADIRDHWTKQRTPTPLVQPEWRELGPSHAHLVIVPAWQCDRDDTPGGFDGFVIFGRLALNQGMTINSYYASRTSDAAEAYFCNRQPQEILATGLAGDSAYVVSPAFLLRLLSAGIPLTKHYCRAVDGFLLCARDPGHAGIEPGLVERICPAAALGQTLLFNAEPSPALIFGEGWSAGESWGRWSDGSAAGLIFRLPPGTSMPVVATFRAHAFLGLGHALHRVRISVGGMPPTEWVLRNDGASAAYTILIPPSAVGRDGLVHMHFEMPDAMRPSAFGAADDRLLGIGVESLIIAQAPSDTK